MQKDRRGEWSQKSQRESVQKGTRKNAQSVGSERNEQREMWIERNVEKKLIMTNVN